MNGELMKPLSWWKEHEVRFPKLSFLAQQILIILGLQMKSFFFFFNWETPHKLGTLSLGSTSKVVVRGLYTRVLKSISTDAQYVTLDNKIKCLSLATIFFGNSTNKTVTGTAYT
jgi:hypothetical protein